MSGHTKGREAVGASGGSVTRIAWCNSPMGAALIAEAFNVVDETGRTPKQLADERAELVAALNECELFIRVLGLDSPHAAETSAYARAILAKVKGPVQS